MVGVVEVSGVVAVVGVGGVVGEVPVVLAWASVGTGVRAGAGVGVGVAVAPSSSLDLSPSSLCPLFPVPSAEASSAVLPFPSFPSPPSTLIPFFPVMVMGMPVGLVVFAVLALVQSEMCWVEDVLGRNCCAPRRSRRRTSWSQLLVCM